MEPDSRRITMIRREMGTFGLDVLVLRLPENVLMASGYWPRGMCWLVVPREEEATLIIGASSLKGEPGWIDDVRTTAYGRIGQEDAGGQQRSILRDLARRHRPRTVGYEGSMEAVAPGGYFGHNGAVGAATRLAIEEAFSGAEVRDATDSIYRLRASKTPREVDALRLTASVTDVALETFSAAVQVGASEAEVAAAVETSILVEGARRPEVHYARGVAFVLSRPRTGLWENSDISNTERRMESGDVAIIEMVVNVNGFWSDVTRTRAAGKPSDQMLEVHAVVLEAQRRMVDEGQPGMSGVEIDALARDYITKMGYGEHFTHHAGHGVGFSSHEPAPMFSWISHESIMPVDAVCAVEPGIYVPDVGGVRIEDEAYFGPGGGEFLNHADRSLC